MSTLSSILTKIIPEDHRWKMTLLMQWPTIIGALHDKVRIEKIEEHVLYLGVEHPSWAQELSFMTIIMRKKINAALGQERIQHIRFRVVTRDLNNEKKKIQKALPILEQTSLADQNDEIVALSEKEKQSLATIRCISLRNIIEECFIRSKKR